MKIPDEQKINKTLKGLHTSGNLKIEEYKQLHEVKYTFRLFDTNVNANKGNSLQLYFCVC